MKYALTDTLTGEIIDLTSLTRKPRGRLSRPTRTYRKKRVQARLSQDATIAIAFVALLLGMYMG